MSAGDKWFTFGYGNTKAWADKCQKCGRWFKRADMDKDRLCDECQPDSRKPSESRQVIVVIPHE